MYRILRVVSLNFTEFNVFHLVWNIYKQWTVLWHQVTIVLVLTKLTDVGEWKAPEYWKGLTYIIMIHAGHHMTSQSWQLHNALWTPWKQKDIKWRDATETMRLWFVRKNIADILIAAVHQNPSNNYRKKQLNTQAKECRKLHYQSCKRCKDQVL